MQTLRFDQKVTLQEIIIENEQLCTSFVEYLASIHAMEAFEFWVEVELYKRILDVEECTKTAKFIFTTYLSPHSPTEINLEGRIRREILEKFSKNPNDPHLFNKAQDSVEMMLKYDCLRVFLEVNKGKARKSTCEQKPRKDKPEPHALLQRYNSLIKLEKKKVRRDSFKKSISGTIRRFTTNENQPKGLALTLKSNSFTIESKPMHDLGEAEERRSDGETEGRRERIVPKRARGKKIRMDPTRKWTMAVGETPGDQDGEDEKGKEDDKEQTEGNGTAPEEKVTTEVETAQGPETEPEPEKPTPKIKKRGSKGSRGSRGSRASTPNNSDWVAYEKPPQQPLNEAGSTEWLVGGSREIKVGGAKTQGEENGVRVSKSESCPEITGNKEGGKRKSGGGLFACFGGTKKKP